MTDENLIELLRRLGIEENTAKRVAVLPLLEVAWADGEIQPEERELIKQAAKRYGLGGDEGQPQLDPWLDKWLNERPSPYFLSRGRQVLRELERRADVPEGLDMEDVVVWCWAVAKAAGGIFGTSWRAIDDEERSAIQDIAQTLRVNNVEMLKTKLPDTKS